MTQVANMYVRHHHHHQTACVGDAVNSSYVRLVGVKCLNVILTILAVFFFLTSTVSRVASHLTATRYATHVLFSLTCTAGENYAGQQSVEA